MTDVVATRLGSEAWITGTPTVRATRFGYEAWFSIIPAVVATKIGREVWFPQTTSSNRRKRRLMVLT